MDVRRRASGAPHTASRRGLHTLGDSRMRRSRRELRAEALAAHAVLGPVVDVGAAGFNEPRTRCSSLPSRPEVDLSDGDRTRRTTLQFLCAIHPQCRARSSSGSHEAVDAGPGSMAPGLSLIGCMTLLAKLQASEITPAMVVDVDRTGTGRFRACRITNAAVAAGRHHRVRRSPARGTIRRHRGVAISATESACMALLSGQTRLDTPSKPVTGSSGSSGETWTHGPASCSTRARSGRPSASRTCRAHRGT